MTTASVPAAWPRTSAADGTIVYHVTTVDAALDIARTGVRSVANAWGGGRLGAGFYTHLDAGAAANYTATPEVTLEFRVNRALQGAVVPQDLDVSQHPGIDYLTGNDFLTSSEDANQELKFHDGTCLTLERVHQGNSVFTLAEWLAF